MTANKNNFSISNLNILKQAIENTIGESQSLLRIIEQLEVIQGDERVNRLLDINTTIHRISDGLQVVVFTDGNKNTFYARAELLKVDANNE